MLVLRRASLQPYPVVTVPHLLQASARRFGNKPALVVGDQTITFAYLHDLVARCAGALSALGMGPGSVIGILLPNSLEFVVAYYGSLLAGARVCPMNPALREREVAYQASEVGLVGLVTDEPREPLADAAASLVPTLRHVLVVHGRAGRDFRALVEVAAPQVDPPQWRIKEEPAVLPFTSGTVGLPKAVMLTQYNLVCNILQFLSVSGVTDRDIFLNHLPFSHIYGMNLLMSGAIAAGATQVIMPRFEAEEFFGLVGRYRPTHLFTVPPVVLALADHPDIAAHDLSSILYITSGAAPLPPDVGRRLERVTGVMVTQGYGLTEASPVTHTNPLDRVKMDSVGIPVPDTEQRIVDPADPERDLPAGEAGELLVRGPQIMKGYWQRPAESAAAFAEGGWLRTGDLARRDDEGYTYIVDRVKEMIKYKGYGIAPAELEAVLHEHPAVADCAVIGAPDAVAGEIPTAFVVRRQGVSVTAEDLLAYVEASVAPYKRIRAIEFVEQIPRSPSGKVLRRLLAGQATRGS